MVEEQIAGPGRGIREPSVLAAMRAVARHRFVPAEFHHEAYADTPLPIGWGQTISQPFIVAFVCWQLRIERGMRVLEIGTGCGYQAAVLAALDAEVWSIEIVEPLARAAAYNVEAAGYAGRVRIRCGDGRAGWPEAAPFDRIVAACATPEIPPALCDQLADGGRMILPVGDSDRQNLVLVEKTDGVCGERSILPVRFVPMTGGSGAV